MGLEYISQPQVFLLPITAVGGIQNGLYDSPVPPLFTSFYTWTSTSQLTATTFPLTGIETLTNKSGSYIVTIGGVVQSPQTYTIDIFNRTLTFDTPVNENTVVLITQIGTIAVSAQSISELTATNSFFNNIIGVNSFLTNITANNSTLLNVTATNLRVLSSQFFGSTVFNTVTATNLIVLSAITQVQQTIVTPTSAISLTAIGNSIFQGSISATDSVTIDDNLTVGGIIYTQNGNSNTWNNNTTLLQTNSANWNSTYATVCSLSALWEETVDINSITTIVASNSSNWNTAYAITTALSSNLWNEAYTLVQNNSASWEESNDITVLSTLIQNNSASWNYQGTDIKTLTANWESTYATVSALSASWEETADILPTVTNYLSTSNVLLSGLTTESITITSNNIFATTNYVNTVSALAITINGTVLYLPLLSAV